MNRPADVVPDAIASALIADTVPDVTSQVGALERLPKWMNLIPMVLQWLWLSIKYRSWTLPSAANPEITAGGLAGEGKSEYFAIMGPLARAHTANFAVIRNSPKTSIVEAAHAMTRAGLEYPLILKPDIGWCGFGVRIVRNADELASYLRSYPLNENIVMQQFISYEGEAGLYYVREPGALNGRITGILLRHFPRVVGDGKSKISDLIAHHPRAYRLGRDHRSEPCCDVTRVPAKGEIIRLCITGSTRVGGLYQDGSSLINPMLEQAIDAIALDMKGLHVARFDVRYESLGSMRDGHSFKIIEVNGAGSEAVHAWDPRYSLGKSYKMVFQKQRTIFSIGDAMRHRGHRPVGSVKMLNLYIRQARLIRQYPPSN